MGRGQPQLDGADAEGWDPRRDAWALHAAAWLAERGLAAVAQEELAALEAVKHELRALYDGLHGHGVVITRVCIDDETVWTPEVVPPRAPLDAPDLPPPYRALRLAVYAGIAVLRTARGLSDA